MRIVVSGTHASGKSTLIADFALRNPQYTALPDPFELLDEARDGPDAGSFAAQLRLSADRLDAADAPEHLIAERGPIDFLAYLLALESVTGEAISREVLLRSTQLTREALGHVDLLVVLPLTPGDAIDAGADEFPELRDAMDEVLLDLIADADVVGRRTRVVEITGGRDRRLAALEAFATAADG